MMVERVPQPPPVKIKITILDYFGILLDLIGGFCRVDKMFL